MERFNSDWDDLARSIGYRDERDMLEDMYERERMPISEIASRLGAGTATINRRLNLLGIAKRTRGGPNNEGRQAYKLFHLDQRVVLRLDLSLLARATRVSRSLCYKYRRFRINKLQGGVNEVLYPVSDRGTTEIQHTVESASRTAADLERTLSQLLRREEEGG